MQEQTNVTTLRIIVNCKARASLRPAGHLHTLKDVELGGLIMIPQRLFGKSVVILDQHYAAQLNHWKLCLSLSLGANGIEFDVLHTHT